MTWRSLLVAASISATVTAGPVTSADEATPAASAAALAQKIGAMTGSQGKPIPDTTAAANAGSGPGGTTHHPAPTRRAGFWELASTDAKGNPVQKQQLCVGGASEERYSSFDQIVEFCSGADFRQEARGYTFQATCDYGEGPVHARGTIVGDLTKDYTVHQTITGGSSGRVEGSIRARHVGPCPEGRKVGDKVIAGDVVVNVLAR